MSNGEFPVKMVRTTHFPPQLIGINSRGDKTWRSIILNVAVAQTIKLTHTVVARTKRMHWEDQLHKKGSIRKEVQMPASGRRRGQLEQTHGTAQDDRSQLDGPQADRNLCMK